MAETRKLAAILVSDVVGYSKLAGSDEDRTLARLRACGMTGQGSCWRASRLRGWRSREGGSDDACFVRRSATGNREFL